MFRVTQKIGNFRFKKQLQTENKYNKKILASFKYLRLRGKNKRHFKIINPRISKGLFCLIPLSFGAKYEFL